MAQDQRDSGGASLAEVWDRVRELESQLDTRNAQLQDRAAALQEAVSRLERENARRREAESRLRVLFENIPIPTVAWQMRDGEFRLASINAAAVNRVGGNAHAWLGTAPESLFGPGSLAVEAMGQAYTSEGTVRANSDWCCRRTGQQRNWDLTCGFVPPDSVVVHFEDVTEQFAASEALQKSEQRFQQMAGVIDQVFWLGEAGTGRVLYTSPAFEHIYGWPPELLADDPNHFFKVILEEDQPGFAEKLELQRQGLPAEHEYRIQWPDGQVRWVRARSFPVFDEAGRHTLNAGTVEDITARKQAEEAVHKREAWFREVLNHASDGGWEHDFQAGMTQTTDSFWTNLGYSEPRNVLPSAEWAKLTHKEDYAQGREAQARFFRGETPRLEAELRIRRSDGSYAWLLSRGVAAQTDEDGVPVRVMGTVTDITERKLAEERLRQYERAVESAQDMIAVLDREGRFVLANPAFLEQMGFERGAVIGRPADEVFENEARFASLWPYWEACIEGRFVSFNLTGVNPQGLPRILSISFAPLHGDGNAIEGIVAVARDTTEIMQARRELQEQGKALRRLAAKLAEASENERRQLSRELHDQIGQELTGLRLLLDTASRAAEPPPSLQQARSLVDDLLKRVRELSLNLRPQMLDDLGIVPALVWLFESYTKQTGIEVDFQHEQAAGERFDEAVETAAFRIVQEALTNVARHACTDRAVVRIICERSMLLLRVEDQGVGFAVEEEKAAPGTAGLVGMRERVLGLGGALRLESKPGRGTVVQAWLPARARQQEEEEST